jgi:type IV pilus assembly protein PilB
MALKKKFLGELLIEAGVISVEQRDKAMQEQKRLGKRLGETLVSLGFTTEESIAKALSSQLSIPYKELRFLSLNPEVIDKVPELIARKHKVLPLEINNGKLIVAMVDPLDIFAIDEITRITKMPVDISVARESELISSLDRYYRGGVDEAMKEADIYQPEKEKTITPDEAMLEDTPIVKLVTTILTQAVKDRASDIHIEPYADSLRVRFRIDGKLQEIMRPPRHIQPGMTSRIKILSGMDIAEKRIPQDGRFPVNLDGRQFDVRASALPTLYGEKIVLRLLEKTTGAPQVKLSELGFSEQTLRIYEKLIARPYGFILATGPTGSGKTSTIYASLRTINTKEKNTITIEDPIEYNLPEITQVQLNSKAGLTFASGLRSILRQDPDIIMVGEIRDVETASIATHAALTGHLVLSTLHTNDAVGAIARLIDMGVEPFLITSSLIGVLAQRLVVRVCPHCKEKYTAEADTLLNAIGVQGKITLARGKGCTECRSTGYLGRDGLYELLLISDNIKKLIIEKATAGEIKAQALKEGFVNMRQEGLKKVVAGITTLEEVIRVTQEID